MLHPYHLHIWNPLHTMLNLKTKKKKEMKGKEFFIPPPPSPKLKEHRKNIFFIYVNEKTKLNILSQELRIKHEKLKQINQPHSRPNAYWYKIFPFINRSI